MAKKLIFGVVAFVGLMVFAFMRQGEASKDVKGEMRQVLSALPIYANNGTYIDGLLEKAHNAEFSHAYKVGSKARKDTFDQNKYVYDVLTHMVGRCRKDKEDEIGNVLLELRNSTTTVPEKDAGQ